MTSPEASAPAPAQTLDSGEPFTDRLTLPQALMLAMDWLREGRLEQADRLYAAILEQWPEQPDALHYLGITRHAQGDSEGGIALIRRAIALRPQQPGPWNNLGNVLVECQRPDEALQAYRHSIELGGDAPEAADAHNNVGTIHRKREQWAEAEAACREALRLRPDFAEAWYNLSQVLLSQPGRLTDGLVANSKAITLLPRHLQARDQVIRALIYLGERDEAAQLYRQWLAEEPDNPVVQHQLAACLGEDAPERASDAYISTVFDHYAVSFDAKLAQLEYRAPELIAQALADACGEPRRALDIADVGCGTGLCGPLVRPWARRLVGCDLSAGMLRQARPRGVYDLLQRAELVAFLQASPQSFDVIISADTLCYFGDLHAALAAAARSLRRGGHLFFTVEALPEGDAAPHRLEPHGRYAHARTHVAAALAAAGLALQHCDAVALRQEGGRPVSGWLVTAAAA